MTRRVFHSLLDVGSVLADKRVIIDCKGAKELAAIDQVQLLNY